MTLIELWQGFVHSMKTELSNLPNIKNGWKDTDPRVILAYIAGILTTVLWCIRTRRKIADRKKQKELAIQAGRVIKAKCVSYYSGQETDDSTGKQEYVNRGTYEYTVDGKTKRYSAHSNGGLPYVFLYLYYTDSPNKVFSDYDRPELGYNLAGLLGIAAGVLTLFLTGFFYY